MKNLIFLFAMLFTVSVSAQFSGQQCSRCGYDGSDDEVSAQALANENWTRRIAFIIGGGASHVLTDLYEIPVVNKATDFVTIEKANRVKPNLSLGISYTPSVKSIPRQISVVKDGQIITPPITASILEGITRDSVIQIIEENGGYVIEADLDRDDLYSADEVFMTGTAAEVKSVTQIDRIKIGTGKPGVVTKALQKSFMNVAMGKDERFLPWLKYI